MKRTESHTTDLLFTLGLFCVFAASAFLLVLIGIRVYRSTAAQMDDTFSTRTAVSYVAEKLRQHDAAGAARLGELEGQPALILEDETDAGAVVTYIYADSEALWELTVSPWTEPARQLGDRILEVRDFTMRDVGDGFLEFSASDSTGSTVRFLTRLRSEEG